jgi:hypothetical protein
MKRMKTGWKFPALVMMVFITHHAAVFSQSAGIELNIGRGAYEMGDLKNLMQAYVQDSGVPYKETERFPDAVNLGGAFVVGIGKLETGIEYRYYTAKGSLMHSENNEESGLNLGASSHALGLFLKYPIVHSKFFQLKGGLSGSLYSSKLHHKEYYATPNFYNSLKMDFRSKSIVVGPFIEPVIYFTGGLYAGIRFGYAYDFQGALHIREDNKGKFVTASGEAIRTNWTGLRSDIFIGLRINP